MKQPLRRQSVCLLVLASLVAPAARADGDARPEAASHYMRGEELYKQRDCDAAILEFEEAYRLVPAFKVLRSLGESYHCKSRFHEALEAYRRFLDEGRSRVEAAERDHVQRNIETILASTGEVEIRVEGAPAEIRVDGRSVATAVLLVWHGVGRHEVRALREGAEPESRWFEVSAGARQEVVLAPRRREPPAPIKIEVVPVSPPPVPKRPPPPWYRRWYIWTAAGFVVAGGVAAGVGGYFATREPHVDYPYPNP